MNKLQRTQTKKKSSKSGAEVANKSANGRSRRKARGMTVGMGMQQWMFSMHFDAIRRGAYEDIPGMTGWSKKNLEQPQGLMDWEQNKKNGRREAR